MSEYTENRSAAAGSPADTEKEIDYNYIADNISNISRIALRIYENDNLLRFLNTTAFPVDPGREFIDEMLQTSRSVSYFITPYYHYYGILKNGNHTLILGPCYHLQPTHAQIRDYMFSLGIKERYESEYAQYMQSITPMPLEMFLHLICLVHYFITGQKQDMASLLEEGCISSNPLPETKPPIYQKLSSLSSEAVGEPLHDTIGFENQMLQYIQTGNVSELEQLFASSTPGQVGKIASTYIRQIKNTFIAAATLASRAAITGGMPADEALSLSDNYIRHCEEHSDPHLIMNLQHNMIMDYAQRIHSLTLGRHHNHFMYTAITYIQEHLTENLTVETMASDLYLSRSYLSTRFKKEMGMTLQQYIQEQKIEKAKIYLKNTNRSILDISTYLNFSSQSHFQNVFRKYTGMTPKKYREHL
ncbi:MAG: AraC family transcriptional regulator [Eubacteriales bacterium]|nr:AraC family transcriptional regulator [Eubacteriales bacterium]